MTSSKIDEKELRRFLQDEAMELPDMGIAVSGLAGRFPKSDSVAEFEDNLLNGIDMVNDQDESRFSCGLWGLPPRAGRLKDLSKFDCEFFGYSRDESNYIDYQLRILYEVVYESIIDAGLNPASLRGTNTGLFLGFHCEEFETAMADDPNFKSNGYFGQHAVRLAQYFDLRGPTLTFDAACASGFVALHSAAQALNQGQVEQAIVCSVNIPIHPTGSFIFLQMQMLSPTGFSRFLDSRADGYVKSEACVSVLLQRKEVALRNYCSLMSTMTSVDGYKKEGITFPSDKSQERLMRSAKQLAGLSTNHVEYLEAHGTGTPAGDPQEASAISSVYCPIETDERKAQNDQRIIGPLKVGSVKTNMGHSEGVSGLCSLAKVALMLENELIYRGLHFEQPNANIESLKDGRLQFVAETSELRAKIVPLSCYGFGGANVHAIVRANHQPAISSDEDKLIGGDKRLVVMFGRSPQSLNLFFDRLMDTNSRKTRFCLTDDFLFLLNNLNSGQIDRLMRYRGYLVVGRSEGRELARTIKPLDRQRHNTKPSDASVKDQGRRSHLQDSEPRKFNLFYPGLGSYWPKMAAGLQEYKPFWSTIERLIQIFEPFEDDIDLKSLLLDDFSRRLTMAEVFVVTVAYEMALTNMLRHQLKLQHVQGILGHSLGEISCAHAAGILDEREAILVAYKAGRCLDQNKPHIEGKMCVVGLGEQEAEQRIAGYRSIRVSCINGQESVTLSGLSEEMDQFVARNEQLGAKFIDSEVALHNELIMGSSGMEQLLTESIGQVLFPLTDYSNKSTGWISTIEGMEVIEANASYFAGCFCKKVNLPKALARLSQDSVIVELGPKGLFESQLIQARHLTYTKMMNVVEPEDKSVALMKSIGEIYLLGSIMNLNNFYGQAVQLPVRRQTPSLSSLFDWDHQESYFVPRYPLQFSKSSAKCELPIDIVQDRDKYLEGHCVEGRILFPATGYLYQIWRVFSFTKRRVYDACFQNVERELVPIEFRNVRLMRAVILGSRVAQIYIHFEEGTGKWEIKEGGSLVAEGYAFSPKENPGGLLYEDSVRRHIESQDLTLTLTSDDIYKQFRVNGYDYGETFRNVVGSSMDGRRTRIKHNGHFISLTDSILQSIFLVISQLRPSGGLFLPTGFDYVRFNPEIILSKMRAANVAFDLSDDSLNTMAKREIMTKIMQREAADANKSPEELASEREKEGKKETSTKVESTCFFETFCDPETGVIITDGIEMRGIRATPAPRRSDSGNEVLLESYQFVKDHEEPVDDEPLTKLNSLLLPYIRTCDAMSLNLLATLCNKPLERVAKLVTGKLCMSQEQVSSYLIRHLKSRCESPRPIEAIQAIDEDEQQHLYDLKQNGNMMLLSVLDQLCAGSGNRNKIRELISKNRHHLMADLIQKPLASERFIRPLVEMVLENDCAKKSKLKLLEINLDDGLMKDQLLFLINAIAPQVSVDYALAHPDTKRISNHKSIAGQQTPVKTYLLQQNDIQTLFTEHRMPEQDLIVYKDISCYSLPKQMVEENGLGSVMSSLNAGAKLGGYIVVAMRRSLSLAERILLALSEPELIGLGKRDLDELSEFCSKDQNLDCDKLVANCKAISKLEHINTVLRSRDKLMLSEASRNKMLHLATKSDSNGCTLYLFKTTHKDSAHKLDDSESSKMNRKLILINHQSKETIGEWLEKLKSYFRSAGGSGSEREVESHIEEEPAVVWLCAVSCQDSEPSGIVGMAQALGKELGWSRLRCYYDCHSFKSQQKVDSTQLEVSPVFREALRRDLIWNCVDSSGHLGSFRHFTLTEHMAYDQCLCSNTPLEPLERLFPVHGAYVNQTTKGDLSSFSWHEAPYKYLSDEKRRDLVSVAYAALNFRDVMLATGRLPLDAISLENALSDCLLGLEFSGQDSCGRRIMGMVGSRAIASHLLLEGSAAIKLEIPDWLSLRDAATIPVVYATAVMALVYRGKMRRGESVLIHAGTGGVGQAAIRLAAHCGLEIYTTVGSPEKRNFILKEFGRWISSDHIFSSRDCNFEQEIMRLTRGQGVDLILNSLADDKLQASIRCLADGGRFLEIGKYDMSVNAPMEPHKLNNNKTFHGILLDKLFDAKDMTPNFMDQLQCIMSTMKDGLVKGYIRPIKSTVFARNKVEEAFRFMANGRHMGKVLIEIQQEPSRDLSVPLDLDGSLWGYCIPRAQFSSQKTYIVTGGLGGFGLELVKWLVAQGARHLLLTSRSGPKSGYQLATLRRLMADDVGARIEVVQSQKADASHMDGARQLVSIANRLSPVGQLGGVFHLAMVLKDALIEKMSADAFEEVIGPKLRACRELDAACRQIANRKDCYFVAFSSVTSGKGNAGQANYAYANSYLERVCESRRRDKLHGLAIQWGAIGDVGVAFENLGGNNVVVGGTLPQRIPSCLATLMKLISSPFAVCLSVVPANRPQDAIGQRGDLVAAIMHVLGIKDSSKVSEQANLGELGLDSLMAVEIRQYIEREYEMTLNIQEIRSLTIARIREISEQQVKPKIERSDEQNRQQVASVDSYGNRGNEQSQ